MKEESINSFAVRVKRYTSHNLPRNVFHQLLSLNAQRYRCTQFQMPSKVRTNSTHKGARLKIMKVCALLLHSCTAMAILVTADYSHCGCGAQCWWKTQRTNGYLYRYTRQWCWSEVATLQTAVLAYQAVNKRKKTNQMKRTVYAAECS